MASLPPPEPDAQHPYWVVRPAGEAGAIDTGFQVAIFGGERP